MLIQFTVGNYLSFKDKVTLSMEATSIKEHPENVFETPDGRYRLLKSVAIYGANGSGKSNLMKAMDKMYDVLKSNSKLSSTDKLNVIPFKLSTETDGKPSFFEIIFIMDKIKYRYGFEINDNEIVSEWLFEAKRVKEKALFVREQNNINILSGFNEGLGLESKTGPNKLFLTIVDQFNGEIAKKIYKWFLKRFKQFSALEHDQFAQLNRMVIGDDLFKPIALNLYEKLQLGFQDFDLLSNGEKFDVNRLPTDQIISFFNKEGNKNLFEAKTKHNKYDSQKKIIGYEILDMSNEESKGTNKIFNCSVFFLLLLKEGTCLAIDELDASLHPLMTLAITKLFNSEENNPENSQLIFTTHDTNLLAKGGFRRDQIYFVEKDNYEVSHLYSLAEFKEDGKKVRKDRSFEEDYIQGRYGAIPFIGNFSKLLSDGE